MSQKHQVPCSHWGLRSLYKSSLVKNKLRVNIQPYLRPTCPDLLMLQDHSVINKANVLGGVVGLGPLLAQEMQDAGGQNSEFAVLDEFAQV